jgi:hypothetical protein
MLIGSTRYGKESKHKGAGAFVKDSTPARASLPWSDEPGGALVVHGGGDAGVQPRPQHTVTSTHGGG